VLTQGNVFSAGGGQFVLGQEQDDLHLEFHSMESYVGDLTLLHVWDTVLSAQEVLAMNTFCNHWSGVIISWPEFRFNVHGNIKILNSTFCTGELLEKTYHREIVGWLCG